jgi:hypothetical protein
MNRREFCGAVGVLAAGAAIGAVVAAPERVSTFLAPVLEVTDSAGNVLGYSNKDFVGVGAQVRANGLIHNAADLRGEWKTAHHLVVCGE